MDYKKPKVRWEIQSKLKTQNSKFKVEDLVNILLDNRGIKTKKERDEFLSPKLDKLKPKDVGIDLTQLKKASTRVEKAIKNKEEIIIFGDYDVDGITGTAILWETLHKRNAKVLPYIPHRTDEGYGLSIKAIDNLLQKLPDTKLIITVDNGIVADAAVSHATKKGIDVIITDHHLPEKITREVKGAFATVHTTELCGSAVAYVFSQEFKKSEVGDTEDRHLELAALGTFADMMPLTKANRAIAYHGIKKLKTTKRPGLLALYEEAGVEIENISEYTIGHVIAPRLNATGRLESGMDSLRLLCTRDQRRAKELAAVLGKINKERQNVLLASSIHAKSQIANRKSQIAKIIIIAHEEYQEGVIGLIAGRLVEEFYRPAIVIAKREGESKASVRSVSGFNIIEFLRSHKDLFVNVGGHPMAAGFTVKTETIESLTLHLEKSSIEHVTDDMLHRKIKIDMELDIGLIGRELFDSLCALEPFGIGNPRPVFLSQKIKLNDFRVMGKDGKHLRLNLGDTKPIEAVAFNMGERIKELEDAKYLDVVYTIDENTWNGNTKLQLKLKDFRKV